jgi:predicted nucleotidyltransferase
MGTFSEDALYNLCEPSESLVCMEDVILKVLVGSQAHGLAGRESDADYRGVYVMPTVEMFRLGFRYQGTRWAEDIPDDTSKSGSGKDETLWEVGQFLALAVHCHPLLLEALQAPVVFSDRWGHELRALWPSIWEPRRAYEAFTGYAANQRKKMLEKKDARPAKYAAAYIRVLYNLCELLETGRFTVRILETPVGKTIADLKDGRYRPGEIIDLGEQWLDEADRRLARCRHVPDLSRVDDYLVRVRKAFLAD